MCVAAIAKKDHKIIAVYIVALIIYCAEYIVTHLQLHIVTLQVCHESI